MRTELTIIFPTPRSAEYFRTWLCEQGEQDYWNFMECQDDARNETVDLFDYRNGKIEAIIEYE